MKKYKQCRILRRTGAILHKKAKACNVLQCKSFALVNMLPKKKSAAYLKANSVSLLELPLPPIVHTNLEPFRVATCLGTKTCRNLLRRVRGRRPTSGLCDCWLPRNSAAVSASQVASPKLFKM